MNTTKIERLIRERVAEWEHFDHKLFALPNQNFKPPANKVWYRLTIQSGVNMMSGMDEKPRTRELGAVVVQIFTPENQPLGQAKTLADSLNQHLSYFMKDELELLTGSVIDVGFNEFYQINVRVPYRYK